MTDHKPARDELSVLFRDVVLVLGGVFAVQGTDDETIRRIARGLERAYLRAKGSLEQPTTTAPKLTPHPDIAALLRLADREGAAP